MSPFVFIALSVTCSVCGQLSLKHGMSLIARSATLSVLARMVTSPWVIGGLAVYGVGVISWLFALSHLELSYAYPFSSLGYVGIILGSYFLFKERISAIRLVGIGVIILGLLIISQS
jgi:multidrug transporter EmrE-like cation transporter